MENYLIPRIYEKRLLEEISSPNPFMRFLAPAILPRKLSLIKRLGWWFDENVWWRFDRFRPDTED